jgi:hypothetical protein
MACKSRKKNNTNNRNEKKLYVRGKGIHDKITHSKKSMTFFLEYSNRFATFAKKSII